MEAQELHRGRLIDHIQLVVKDLAASRRFYESILEALGIPMGGVADDYFWVDELFVSTADSAAAQGSLTGRQQHRGGLPRRGTAQRRFRTHRVLIGASNASGRRPAAAYSSDSAAGSSRIVVNPASGGESQRRARP